MSQTLRFDILSEDFLRLLRISIFFAVSWAPGADHGVYALADGGGGGRQGSCPLVLRVSGFSF